MTAGISLASLDIDGLIADEYVALGISYSVGALTVGAGVENRRLSVPTTGPDSTAYLTNYFAGAEDELALGLFLGVGLGNLDGDQFYYNRDTRHFADTPRTVNATASIRVEF